METSESEMKICENLNKMLADRQTEVSQCYLFIYVVYQLVGYN